MVSEKEESGLAPWAGLNSTLIRSDTILKHLALLKKKIIMGFLQLQVKLKLID